MLPGTTGTDGHETITVSPGNKLFSVPLASNVPPELGKSLYNEIVTFPVEPTSANMILAPLMELKDGVKDWAMSAWLKSAISVTALGCDWSTKMPALPEPPSSVTLPPHCEILVPRLTTGTGLMVTLTLPEALQLGALVTITL